MSFEKAVSNLEGSEKSSLLVMDRDLNPTTAPIGESPMVQFLICKYSCNGKITKNMNWLLLVQIQLLTKFLENVV